MSTAIVTNTSGPVTSDGFCSCCITCGPNNTCNDYCHPQYAAFERGPDCPCPCDDRNDYPRNYRGEWSVGLTSGRMAIAPGFNDDYDYAACSGGGATFAITWDTVSGACIEPSTILFSQTIFKEDGTEGPTYNTSLGVSVGADLSDCGTKITFRINVSETEGYPSSTGVGILADAVSSAVSRCLASGSATGASYDPLIASVGDLIWEISCEDCNGDPSPHGEDLAEVCADEKTLTITMSDSFDFVDMVLPVNGGSVVFGDTTGFATIEVRHDEDGDEKCCPMRSPTDCVECPSGPQGSDCEECWTLTVCARHGAGVDCCAVFHGRGSCPPEESFHWTLISETCGDEPAEGLVMSGPSIEFGNCT